MNKKIIYAIILSCAFTHYAKVASAAYDENMNTQQIEEEVVNLRQQAEKVYNEDKGKQPLQRPANEATAKGVKGTFAESGLKRDIFKGFGFLVMAGIAYIIFSVIKQKQKR